MKIAVLINPLSGGINKKKLPDRLKNVLPESTVIHISESADDTRNFAAFCRKETFDLLIVAGGDGTLNDVGTALLGSNTAIGIYPQGSGNGLGRMLGAKAQPMALVKSIEKADFRCIDTGKVNERTFLNLAGVGFDAHIAERFANNAVRGFSGYISETLRTFGRYKAETYTLRFEGQELELPAFLLTVCNGSQYGNNAWISPQSDLFDGQLEMNAIGPMSWAKTPSLAYALFTKRIGQHSGVRQFCSTEFFVHREFEGPVNIDGEFETMGKELHFRVIPRSLRVLMPV